MAEAVGTVSAAIGIADFAAQIGSAILKVKAFWDEVKEAPEEIKDLMLQAESLRVILCDIEDFDRKYQFPTYIVDNTNVKANLSRCQDVLKQLESLVEKLDLQMNTGSRIRKTFGAVNSTLKKDQISKIKAKMDISVRLMEFSQRRYDREIFNLQFSRLIPSPQDVHIDSARTASRVLLPLEEQNPQNHSNLALTPKPSREVKEKSKIPRNTPRNTYKTSYWWVIGNKLLGTVDYKTETASTLVEQGSINSGSSNYLPINQQTRVRVRPPSWALKKAWEANYQRTYGQWKFLFRAYNIMSYDSPVCRCIGAGDLEGIQDLFSRREATPYDRMSDGRTLLCVAIGNGRDDTLHISRFLQQQIGSLDDNMEAWSLLQATIMCNMGFNKKFDELCLMLAAFLESSFDYDFSESEASIMGKFEGSLNHFIMITAKIFPEYFYRPQFERTIAVLDMADKYNFEYHSPILIFSALGRKEGMMDPEIVYQMDSNNGETLLHKCATALGYCTSPEFEASSELEKELKTTSVPRIIQSGATQHAPAWTSDLYENWCLFSKLVIEAGAWLHVWCPENRTWNSIITSALRAWLEALVYAGVDLEEYGETEKEHHDEGLINQDLRFWPDGAGEEVYGRPPACHIISFAYGPSPSDWCIWCSEPTDEFAGTFWELVERPIMKIPGAWEDYAFNRAEKGDYFDDYY